MLTGTRPFRPITTAPNNAAVEVIHGAPPSLALAIWDAQLEAWIRVGDSKRRPLHRVTGWRPLGGKDDLVLAAACAVWVGEHPMTRPVLRLI